MPCSNVVGYRSITVSGESPMLYFDCVLRHMIGVSVVLDSEETDMELYEEST
jgi:hypothetical protein